jgi:hypothetical protein
MTTTDRTPLMGANVTDAQTNLTKVDVTLSLDAARIARSQFSYNRDTDQLRYTPGTDLSSAQHTVKVVARDSEGLVTRKSWSFSTAAP